MKKNNLILAIVILGFILGFAGYTMYNKPHVDVSETASDVTISANDLFNAFSNDETASNTKYLDKIIEVKGVVHSLKVEEGKGIVTLQTTDDFGSVMCHLSEESTQKIHALKEGQTVTLKGICTGYLMDVVLVKSEIIN